MIFDISKWVSQIAGHLGFFKLKIKLKSNGATRCTIQLNS
jgi:hypothetical protein